MEVIEAEPGCIVRNALEERGERFRIEIKVHEHERSPRVDLDGNQRKIVVAERTEPLPRRHLLQRTGEIPTPAVIPTPQL